LSARKRIEKLKFAFLGNKTMPFEGIKYAFRKRRKSHFQNERKRGDIRCDLNFSINFFAK
jgi:hypothetical protein